MLYPAIIIFAVAFATIVNSNCHQLSCPNCPGPCRNFQNPCNTVKCPFGSICCVNNADCSPFCHDGTQKSCPSGGQNQCPDCPGNCVNVMDPCTTVRCGYGTKCCVNRANCAAFCYDGKTDPCSK